ncbi:MAG: site-specific integrase [Magnetovibrionaceae bacterium]
MKRRQRGSGGIREKRSGVWELKFDLSPDPLTGKRRTRYATFKGSKIGAQAELRRRLREVDTGEYADSAKVTLKDFLGRWLDHIATKVAPKTFERYEQLITNNINPALGSVKLSNLKAVNIDQAWSKLMQDGRLDGKGGLSAQTVQHCHRLLKQTLDQAVRWQLLNRNPADAVEPPRVPRNAPTVLDVDQTVVLLEAIRDTQFYMPTLIALTTGLRRGEVLALTWGQINLDQRTLVVSRSVEQTKKGGIRIKEPKSKKARQVIIPSILEGELRQHRKVQAEQLLKLGVRQDQGTPVCCRGDGSLLNPEDLSRRFPEAVVRAGLPRVTFHQLRHSHATQLLLSGVHPKVAQERLGHSSIGITMDLYSHVIGGLQEEAANRVDSALQNAINGASRPA